MLQVSDLKAAYKGIQALRGVSLEVAEGEMVALIGPNGAGKSTLLNCISGVVRPVGGSIRLGGEDVTGQSPWLVSRRGLLQVPEGRQVLPEMTVLENLRMGAYLVRDRAVIARQAEQVFAVFPRLRERARQSAGTLSGGEQQMLAIGRALMGRPRFLMLDEPSLGIAPLLVKTIFAQIVRINREHGITILLVEQNAHLALEISARGYVLETGCLLLHDTAAALRDNPRVREAYLGG